MRGCSNASLPLNKSLTGTTLDRKAWAQVKAAMFLTSVVKRCVWHCNSGTRSAARSIGRRLKQSARTTIPGTRLYGKGCSIDCLGHCLCIFLGIHHVCVCG